MRHPKRKRDEIEKSLKEALRVGARPLLIEEWSNLLEEAGFSVKQVIEAPMKLLTPIRLIQDEGVFGLLHFISRAIRSPGAIKRILKIRGTFGKYSDYINSVAVLAEKPS